MFCFAGHQADVCSGLQAIKQMYVLVLGLDVLGNPFGLLRGMAEGIEDLFYEPYQVGDTDLFSFTLLKTLIMSYHRVHSAN